MNMYLVQYSSTGSIIIQFLLQYVLQYLNAQYFIGGLRVVRNSTSCSVTQYSSTIVQRFRTNVTSTSNLQFIPKIVNTLIGTLSTGHHKLVFDKESAFSS